MSQAHTCQSIKFHMHVSMPMNFAYFKPVCGGTILAPIQ